MASLNTNNGGKDSCYRSAVELPWFVRYSVEIVGVIGIAVAGWFIVRQEAVINQQIKMGQTLVQVETKLEALANSREIVHIERRLDSHDNRFENITSRLRVLETKPKAGRSPFSPLE